MKIFLKSRLRQSNQGRQYSHMHLVPFRRRNSMYLLFIAGISSLKSLQISQHLLNNLIVQILASYLIN